MQSVLVWVDRFYFAIGLGVRRNSPRSGFPGNLALDLEWAARELRQLEGGSETLGCLIHAADVAGFEFYLVGNEVYAE